MQSHTHTKLGTRHGWSHEHDYASAVADRLSHTYVIGKTGTGKSTLLRNVILQDIRAGRGVGLIDPHGDLAESVLAGIPPHRLADVVYFNAADTEYPISWNILKNSESMSPALVASGIVSAFKAIWRDSWGPRLEYLLYAAVASLLECENTSLLGVSRILSDKHYRAWVVKQVHDPGLLWFWQNEFEKYDERFIREVIAPVQNKVGQLLLAPHVRNIFGQVQSKISMRFVMDNRRIFIANLAKGVIGDDKANLLGALLVSAFQNAAMSRATVPEAGRTDFHLVIDEFQNFSTEAFASILSEARKYRLGLTVAHQYIEQMTEPVRAAVFGNIGTMIAFRVGEQDAAHLAREFGNNMAPGMLADLANFEAYVRPLAKTTQSEPVQITTCAPDMHDYGTRQTIVRHSRERFASKKQLVEEKLRRWLGGKH
jgi:hypothetical protein